MGLVYFKILIPYYNKIVFFFRVNIVVMLVQNNFEYDGFPFLLAFE